MDLKQILDHFMRIKRVKLNSKGFTLIELLIAMVISGIVMAGIIKAYNSQQQISTAQNQAVEMQQTIRTALYIMTAELKKAGFDPKDDFDDVGIIKAGSGASSAEALEFTYVDPSTVGTASPAKKTIKYYWNEFKIQGTGGPVAENIANLQFVYLDQDGNPTIAIDDIRAVRITIQVTPNVNERDLNLDRTLATTVKFRNLGL